MPSRTHAPISASAAARPMPDVAALADFRPTATQRRFVQLAIAAQTPLRIAAVCEQLGIARSTYYRWLDQPGFRAWMSLQWATALFADGGRLLSIARSRAETDFRYWKALAELIFDPRGLGLLAAWQQRMASSFEDAPSDSPAANDASTGQPASPAPLFTPRDAKDDSEFEFRLAALEDPVAAEAAPPTAPEPPAAPAEDAPVAPQPPVESTSCTQPTQHNPAPPEPAGNRPEDPEPPSPYVPRIPPPWPNGGGRFHS